MKRRFIVYSVWFMAIMLVPFFTLSKSYAYTVSSDELIERAKDLDSRTVVYRGELVTGILNRGAHSWINLNDGSNAIGVWCDTDLLKNIKHAGSYKTKGDIIEVEGIFIFVGINPTTDFIDVDKDGGGFIKTSQRLETSIPGIYAAGDCRTTPLLQVATAVGDGALAAWAAIDYVETFDNEAKGV